MILQVTHVNKPFLKAFQKQSFSHVAVEKLISPTLTSPCSKILTGTLKNSCATQELLVAQQQPATTSVHF